MSEDSIINKLDGSILFNEIVKNTIDNLKDQETTFSPDDIDLSNLWEEICYQEQGGESIYWDLYMDNLKLWVNIAIDDCAEKYNSSVSDVIEVIYGNYDEEDTDCGEIEDDVKDDIYRKILSYASDDKCVREKIDRRDSDAAIEDMYLSSIAMGMSEEEARERYYGNAEEDDYEDDDE